MAKHTPAPWTVLTQGTGVSIVHVEDHPEKTGGHRICKMHSGKPNIHTDAALIAAAPDLKNAAEYFFKWFDKSGSSINTRWDRIPAEERAVIVSKFRAALSKATPA